MTNSIKKTTVVVETRDEKIHKLRNRIYRMESYNQHKKDPKNDSEMAKDILKTIKRFVDEED